MSPSYGNSLPKNEVKANSERREEEGGGGGERCVWWWRGIKGERN